MNNKREVAFGLALVFLAIFFLLIVFLVIQAHSAVRRQQLVSLSPANMENQPGVVETSGPDVITPPGNCLVMVGKNCRRLNIIPTPTIHTPTMITINTARCSSNQPQISFAGMGQVEIPRNTLPVIFFLQRRCGQWRRITLFDQCQLENPSQCPVKCRITRYAAPGCQTGSIVNAENSLSCGKNRAVLYALSYLSQENITLHCPREFERSVTVFVGNYNKEEKIITAQENSVILDQDGNQLTKVTISGRSVCKFKLSCQHRDKRFTNMRVWRLK